MQWTCCNSQNRCVLIMKCRLLCLKELKYIGTVAFNLYSKIKRTWTQYLLTTKPVTPIKMLINKQVIKTIVFAYKCVGQVTK